jgi:hypothetical protein
MDLFLRGVRRLIFRVLSWIDRDYQACVTLNNRRLLYHSKIGEVSFYQDNRFSRTSLLIFVCTIITIIFVYTTHYMDYTMEREGLELFFLYVMYRAQ